MKRFKKILAVVTIAVFISGSFLSVAPVKASEESMSADQENASNASVATKTEESSITDATGIVCGIPTNNYVNDSLGADIDYFNTADQISGNWDFNDNGCSIEKYQYRFIKKKSPGSPWEPVTAWTTINDPSQKQITANSGNGLTTPLKEGETYRILVRAYNTAGWSVGDVKLADKSDGQILDTIKPVINSFSLFQNKPYGGNITLSWTASDTGVSGIKNYQLYRNGLPLGSALDKTVSSYVDTIFGDNSTYSYYLIAIDEAGNSSSQSTTLFATVDDVAPGAPSISYWIGGGNIVVFWPAVSGATNYELYRNGMLIKSSPEVKYTDTHLAKGQTYNYTAYALDEAGNKSLASNTLSIYVPKPRVSTVATAATGGEVQGETITQGEQVSPSPSPSPSPSGEVQASETSEPEEQSEAANKTNWSLIIAIIIAAAIVVAGVLYWWYARDNEEDEI